jgi:hypothetical protein
VDLASIKFLAMFTGGKITLIDAMHRLATLGDVWFSDYSD